MCLSPWINPRVIRGGGEIGLAPDELAMLDSSGSLNRLCLGCGEVFRVMRGEFVSVEGWAPDGGEVILPTDRHGNQHYGSHAKKHNAIRTNLKKWIDELRSVGYNTGEIAETLAISEQMVGRLESGSK
jgi:hypothetical protein